MRITLVLWSGETGGAETFTATLTAELRRQGHDARLVFVTHGAPLTERLDRDCVPWEQMGLSRGARVVGSTQRLATMLSSAEIVLLPTSGYLASAIRFGGYRGPLIATEHRGTLIDPERRAWRARLVRRRDEILGMWAIDAQVAVSEALRDYLETRRHSALIEVIHNGVTVAVLRERSGPSNRQVVVGAAGRLIEGKGFPQLISAMAPMVLAATAQLRIAGAGPLAYRLEAQCTQAGLVKDAVLLGLQSDMGKFWDECDIAVVPSNECVESFGMVAIEAMAAGLPVVASSQAALAEVVRDGVTGTLVTPGDSDEMRRAIARYVEDEWLRREHGLAGYARVLEEYEIAACARRYVDLFGRVLHSRQRKSR